MFFLTTFDISQPITLFWGVIGEKITFRALFVEILARFYPFGQQVLDPYISLQNKVNLGDSSHLQILTTSHETFALNITFKPGFIGRWALRGIFRPS